MFKSYKKPDFENYNTVLGEGLTFEQGSIKGCGDIRVDGLLFTDLDVDGNLIVGESGYIKCKSIVANNAHISGKIEGDITVSNSVHLTESAHVMGNIDCSSLIIEEKAVYTGAIRMSSNKEARQFKPKLRSKDDAPAAIKIS